MIDFSRVPLWIYGHSFTMVPGTQETPGQEWMAQLAASLGSPSWQSFGVGSSRLIDIYGDISRLAPTIPQADSAWPWNGSRRGAVILQCETNDAICPAEDNLTDSLLLNGKAVANYQQTLEACLGLLAAEGRWDWNTPTASYGTWSGSANPMFLTGSNAWTDASGAWREMKINVGGSGTIGLLTWDVSDTISVTTVGGYQISVDGVVLNTQAARSAGWQNIWTRRGGGYLHNVGPRMVLVGGISPGVHTVRVTSTGGGRVYLDQLVTLRADPNPVLVTKDPNIAASGTHWAVQGDNRTTFDVNRRNLHGAINRAVDRYRGNASTVSMAGIRPEHYDPDGLHLEDLGMTYEAGQVEEALRALTATYEPDLLYGPV